MTIITIVAKFLILDVWRNSGYGYTSEGSTKNPYIVALVMMSQIWEYIILRRMEKFSYVKGRTWLGFHAKWQRK